MPRAAVLLACLALAAAFRPGDDAPAFTVTTLRGPLAVGPGSPNLPLLVACLDERDAFSSHMWRSHASLDALLLRLPPGVSLLLLSYSETAEQAEAMARWMQGQLLDRAAALGLPDVALQPLMRRLHFGTVPAMQLGGWLPTLLAEWHSPRRFVSASARRAAPAAVPPLQLLSAGRLDAAYTWLPWPLPDGDSAVAWAGVDCAWLSAGARSLRRLTGSVALVALTRLPGGPAGAAGAADDEGQASRHAPRCSYGRMLLAAQAAGATAVVFAGTRGAPLAEVNCTSPAECGAAVALPATMVPHVVGEVVRDEMAAGGAVTFAFRDEPGPGLFAGIDAAGRLFDPGWLKFPSLLHAVWAAQWQVYLGNLTARLAEPALVVPVMAGGVPLSGVRGVRASVALPDWHQLAGRDRLELDLALRCPGANDTSCPAWDHALQLFACCDDPEGHLPPCDPCRPTVWQPPGSPGGGGPRSGSSSGALRAPAAGGGAARALLAAGAGQRHGVLRADGGEELCGRELGRWMTPFRRGVGRWLTDVSALGGALLLPGQRCTFTLQAPAWAGPWVPALSLRYSRGSGSGGGGGVELAPPPPPLRRVLLPLPFSGGPFDANYSARHPPFEFSTPPRLRRALLVALVTGHGSDEAGCAEFCPTAHEFAVNGAAHRAEFGAAGTLWGCSDRVRGHAGRAPPPRGKPCAEPAAAAAPAPRPGAGGRRAQRARHLDVRQARAWPAGRAAGEGVPAGLPASPPLRRPRCARRLAAPRGPPRTRARFSACAPTIAGMGGATGRTCGRGWWT